MPGAPEEWCPDWYPILKAANYAHIPPWEFMGLEVGPEGVPVFWRYWILDMMNAEAEAREARRQRATH